MHALTHEFTPIHTQTTPHTTHTQTPHTPHTHHTTPHHTLYSHHTYTHHTHTPHHTTHTYMHTPHIHTHHTYTHHTHTTHTHHTLHSHHTYTHTTPYTGIDRDKHIILILQVGMKNEGHSSQTVAPVRLSYQSDCHIYKNAKFKEWMLNIPLSGARH